MSGRLLKCYGWCDTKHPKSELTQYKNKNYCAECYQRKKEDDDGRVKLLNTISEIFDIPYANGQMLRQMKNFRDDRNYKYNDQAKALWYGKHVLRKDFNTKYGLGLIPYIIDDAIKYFDDNREKKEKMKDISSINNTKVVIQKKRVTTENKYKKDKILDMESVLK